MDTSECRSIIRHEKFGYRISTTTGKKLPSKREIEDKISQLESEIETLRKQQQEHMIVKSK